VAAVAGGEKKKKKTNSLEQKAKCSDKQTNSDPSWQKMQRSFDRQTLRVAH
jgi:hypothetical protein